MNTWFLTKKPKLCNGKKKASSTNGVGITGCQHVEEYKYTSIPMHNTQAQMDQRPQYKFNHPEPDRRESGKK